MNAPGITVSPGHWGYFGFLKELMGTRGGGSGGGINNDVVNGGRYPQGPDIEGMVSKCSLREVRGGGVFTEEEEMT